MFPILQLLDYGISGHCLGLVAPAKQKGRYKAAFNLEEYGISGVVEEEGEKING